MIGPVVSVPCQTNPACFLSNRLHSKFFGSGRIDRKSLLLLLISKGIRKQSKSTPKLSKGKSDSTVNPHSIVEYSIVDKTKVEYREAEFKNSLRPHLETYSKELLNSFYLYWTEKSPKGRKMRFEKQTVFDVSRRLKTWSSKEKSSAKKEIKSRLDGFIRR